jgi:hypothetical protein
MAVIHSRQSVGRSSSRAYRGNELDAAHVAVSVPDLGVARRDHGQREFARE